MKGEIAAAARRIEERKIAAYGPPDERGDLAGGGVDLEATDQLSGLDLDPGEASRAALRARRLFELAVSAGADPSDAGAALWLEGLAVGLLIAEARKE
jgi:hypothetical protein